jgi:hypothetical protein
VIRLYVNLEFFHSHPRFLTVFAFFILTSTIFVCNDVGTEAVHRTFFDTTNRFFVFLGKKFTLLGSHSTDFYVTNNNTRTLKKTETRPKFNIYRRPKTEKNHQRNRKNAWVSTRSSNCKQYCLQILQKVIKKQLASTLDNLLSPGGR